MCREFGEDAPQTWVTHSWGGVLATAHLARFPEHRKNVGACIHFGTTRSIRCETWEAFWKGRIVWNRLLPIICRTVGYFPARAIGFGRSVISLFVCECTSSVIASQRE